jgi:hypothetical protein
MDFSTFRVLGMGIRLISKIVYDFLNEAVFREKLRARKEYLE